MKKFIYVVFVFMFVANAAFSTVYQVGESKTDLKVKKGDKIIVVLSENPTTGYTWFLSVINPTDNEVLVEKSRKFVKSKSKVLGAGGCVRYEVRAINKGKASIQGINTRPWENSENNSSYKLNVVVK